MSDPSPSPGTFRRRRRRAPVGAPPGTLQVDPHAPQPVLRAFAYGPDGVVELQQTTVAAAAALQGQGRILWLDVTGLGNAKILAEVGERFALHRLALADVANSQQRAKVEEYPEHLFLVVRTTSGDGTDTEQLSLFLGDGLVITFQERPGDAWDPIRKRLAEPGGRLRQSGPDYLAYALLDAVVDAYFPVLERVGSGLEDIEERILGARAADLVADLHDIRRQMLGLRRALWPLREVSHALVRGEAPRFQPPTRVYLRDVHDHVVQLLDLLENYREMGTSLMDVHLATVSNRLNEVMKVLTVIATIFIPLTFVVGVYGMNFKHNMPELEWEWGYPACWAVMVTIAGSMLWWFRRRGWL